MKQTGIYQIQSKIKPERIYIGSAVHINKRRLSHLCDLNKRRHHSGRLQNHVNKYGTHDLVFSVLETCPLTELLTREQHYLDTLNPYFNICRIAGSALGVKHPPEVRKRMSESWKPSSSTFKKGHNTPIEWRESQSRTKKAKYPNGVHTPEMSKLIGLKNKGRKMPEEHRQRLIALNKTRIWTDEARSKVGEKQRGNKNCVGRVMTDESKEKIRKAHLGKKASDETKKKLSLIHKGKPFSEEHKMKISLALKKRFEDQLKKTA